MMATAPMLSSSAVPAAAAMPMSATKRSLATRMRGVVQLLQDAQGRKLARAIELSDSGDYWDAEDYRSIASAYAFAADLIRTELDRSKPK
jgi:hypothetical protein